MPSYLAQFLEKLKGTYTKAQPLFVDAVKSVGNYLTENNPEVQQRYSNMGNSIQQLGYGARMAGDVAKEAGRQTLNFGASVAEVPQTFQTGQGSMKSYPSPLGEVQSFQSQAQGAMNQGAKPFGWEALGSPALNTVLSGTDVGAIASLGKAGVKGLANQTVKTLEKSGYSAEAGFVKVPGKVKSDIVYHGTTPENAKAIEKSGFKVGTNWRLMGDVQSPIETIEGIHFSADKGVAEAYGSSIVQKDLGNLKMFDINGKDGMKIMKEYGIDNIDNLDIENTADIAQSLYEKAKSLGYDGLKDNDLRVIFDSKKLNPKSIIPKPIPTYKESGRYEILKKKMLNKEILTTQEQTELSNLNIARANKNMSGEPDWVKKSPENKIKPDKELFINK